MSKLRKNFFIGVRTPWTLASNEVWSRIHRLAGWAFALGGIALIIEGIAGLNPLVFAGIIALVVVLAIIYSYVLYKKIEGFGPNGSQESSFETHDVPRRHGRHNCCGIAGGHRSSRGL